MLTQTAHSQTDIILQTQFGLYQVWYPALIMTQDSLIGSLSIDYLHILQTVQKHI